MKVYTTFFEIFLFITLILQSGGVKSEGTKTEEKVTGGCVFGTWGGGNYQL